MRIHPVMRGTDYQIFVQKCDENCSFLKQSPTEIDVLECEPSMFFSVCMYVCMYVTFYAYAMCFSMRALLLRLTLGRIDPTHAGPTATFLL